MTGSLKKRRGVLIKHYAGLFNAAAGVALCKGEGSSGDTTGGVSRVRMALAVAAGALAIGALVLWRKRKD